MASRPRTLRTFICALLWAALLEGTSAAQGPPLNSSQSFPKARDESSDRVTGVPEGGLAVGSWLFASRSSANSPIYRLNEFDVEGVYASGKANLALSSEFSATYNFRSPSRSKLPKGTPKGMSVDRPCKIYVECSAKQIEVWVVEDDEGARRILIGAAPPVEDFGPDLVPFLGELADVAREAENLKARRTSMIENLYSMVRRRARRARRSG